MLAHTLASGGAMRLLSSGVGLVGGLVTTALLVRTLGVSEFGVYALAMSVTSLLAILAEMGIGTGVSRMAAFLAGDRSAAWTRTAFRAAASAGILLAALTVLASLFLPADARLALIVAAPLIPIWAIWSVQRGYLAAGMRPGFVESVTIGTQFAGYALVILLVAGGWATAVAILAAQVVARGATVAMLAPTVRRDIKASPGAGSASPREVISFSYPLMLAGVAGAVLQRSDVVMIGVIAGAAAAGSYEPILRLLDVAPLVVASLGYYLFPVGASLVRQGDLGRLRAAYVSISKWGMVLTMPLLMTMVVAPAPLLAWLYGGEFVDSGTVAATLAVGYAVNVIAGVNGGALVALGATRPIAVRSVVSIVCNLLGNLLLIPAFGALGAAVATTVVTIGLNVWNSALAWRLARITPFRRDSVLCLGSMATTTLVLVLALPSAARSSLAGAVSVLVVVAGAGGLVALLTLHPAERRLARDVAAALRGARPRQAPSHLPGGPPPREASAHPGPEAP